MNKILFILWCFSGFALAVFSIYLFVQVSRPVTIGYPCAYANILVDAPKDLREKCLGKH